LKSFKELDDVAGGVNLGVLFEAGELGTGVDFDDVGFVGLLVEQDIDASDLGVGEFTDLFGESFDVGLGV